MINNNNKHNAICSICGTSYYKCLSCKDTMKLSPWKKHTDTSEHYKVFQVLRGYNTGVYTKEEAKLKLYNIDLSDLESYREHIKELIKEILKEDKIEMTEIKVEEVELNQLNIQSVENETSTKEIKAFKHKKSFNKNVEQVVEQEVVSTPECE